MYIVDILDFAPFIREWLISEFKKQFPDFYKIIFFLGLMNRTYISTIQMLYLMYSASDRNKFIVVCQPQIDVMNWWC